MSVIVRGMGRSLIEFQSPRRWGGVGLTCDYGGTYIVNMFVSIPSEVGRGRALIIFGVNSPRSLLRFQSPRRWGEVGLLFLFWRSVDSLTVGFNPLGGGARSGSAVAATTGPT